MKANTLSPGLLLASALAPNATLKTLQLVTAVRRELQRNTRAYSGARPNPSRKIRPTRQSGGALARRDTKGLREYARTLDNDDDLITGLLDNLEVKVCGKTGIAIDPTPLNLAGEIHDAFAERLERDWLDFWQWPEVTRELSGVKLEKLACRTWLRDGEVFTRLYPGWIDGLEHGSALPLSIEVSEPDFVPLGLDNFKHNLLDGIERDRWGRARRIFFLPGHPGDTLMSPAVLAQQAKPFPASHVIHLKLTKRLHQSRGVSLLAAVIDRVDALKDFEDSEQTAARISAKMVAVLHRNGGPDGFEMPTNDEGQSVLPAEKDFEFADGMVFDDMLPGEDIKVLESNRPSPMLEPFRKAIGRRIAAGTKSGASEVLKDFSGSYSASRLELVNQYGIYGALTEEFVRQWKMQIYVWFVRVWLLTHPRDIPSDLDMTTVFDADYIAPATPWIDPYKEAAAWEKLQRQNAATPDMVVRMAGGSPRKVRKALEALAKLNKEKEIASSGDVANDGGQLRHEVDAVAMTSDDTTYNQS